nr:hypothetical protein [uncultured Granulicatella sp.]
MNIRKAMDIDFNRIMEIYKNAQLFMIESGNPNQWGTLYPSPELIREDILAGISYVIEEETKKNSCCIRNDERSGPHLSKNRKGCMVE